MVRTEARRPVEKLEALLGSLDNAVAGLKEWFAVKEAAIREKERQMAALTARLEKSRAALAEQQQRLREAEKRAAGPQQAALEHYAAYCQERARAEALSELLERVGAALGLADWRVYDVARVAADLKSSQQAVDLLKRAPEETFLERLENGRWRVFAPGHACVFCDDFE